MQSIAGDSCGMRARRRVQLRLISSSPGSSSALIVKRPSERQLLHGHRGFTLLELMFAVAVTAILVMLAIGQFDKAVERSRRASAIGDISMMAVEIERFRSANQNALPADLTGIGRGAFLDPWQRPYHFTNLTGRNGRGAARKDHRLNPINSEYDLFSAGKNGVFKPQVSQKDSLDDVIRARDGAFVGLASDF